MLIIPAIDIKDGKCVRLKQGVFSDKTVYSDRPEEVALRFQKSGAKRLHIIDLDGAESGLSQNKTVVEKILSTINIPIQLGGGIRDLNHIKQWLKSGIDFVIIGTMAVKNPGLVETALEKFAARKIILAVDAKNGKVAVEGWQKESGLTAIELANRFKEAGLERILFTDITRDGMLNGPDLDLTKEIAISTGLKVTASGGVASKQDLESLNKIEPFGVDSVIVGRAFYEGRILPEEVF